MKPSSVTSAAACSAPPRVPHEVPHKIGRFSQGRVVKTLRAVFGVLDRVSPPLAARLACRLLTTPHRVAERPWQTAARRHATLGYLLFRGRRLAIYTWGAGPTVLMVHGWGSRATHMAKMIAPLVEAGHRVVAFDAPGHGLSSGYSTDPLEYAAAVAAVAEHVGQVHVLLAHSFGAGAAMWSQRDWGWRAQRQILVGALDNLKWVTEEFGRCVGLSHDVLRRGQGLLASRYGGKLDWDNLSVVDMLWATNKPTLLVHDADDDEIPFAHCMALQRGFPAARLHITDGLGHHRLLGDPGVIERVVDFASAAA